MQDTRQKTNQRMPGRSAEVIGKELGVRATPPSESTGAPKPAPAKKPVIKLNPKVPHH